MKRESCVRDSLWGREYKPELERLAAERKSKNDEEKKTHLEKLMNDMNMKDKSNPFGPHAMNEREDRYYDEMTEIERQEEEEEDAAYESDVEGEESEWIEAAMLNLDDDDLFEKPKRVNATGMSWPAP